MVNPSKDKGTKGETAVVRVAKTLGWPADRLTLTGNHDRGDVKLNDRVMVEVKSGHQATGASANQIAAWLDETERERINGGWDYAFLVTQRRGFWYERAAHWDAWLAPRADGDAPDLGFAHDVVVRVDLVDALTILRRAGYRNDR